MSQVTFVTGQNDQTKNNNFVSANMIYGWKEIAIRVGRSDILFIYLFFFKEEESMFLKVFAASKFLSLISLSPRVSFEAGYWRFSSATDGSIAGY